MWQPGLIWLHGLSDGLIGVAYFSIPVALVVVLRARPDIVFGWMVGLFAAFILFCGATHFLSIVTLWQPVYWLDGGVKALTAILSVSTAIMLWRLIPDAIALPSPSAMAALNRDLARQIEERDRAEQALRISEAQLREALQREAAAKMEARFRLVVEAAPSAIVVTNQQGTIELVNAQTERLFGYPREALLGQPIETLVPDRLRDQHIGLRSGFAESPIARSMGDGRELFGRRRDGTEFPVEIGLNPVDIDDGHMILSSIVDISDRRHKEQKIEAALREKETLLKEVHHRVKNNLQIVCSLLDLQAARIEDPVAAATLVDSQNRVRSMALIYQTLYQSEDFHRVDFSEFLLTLSRTLVATYDVEPGRIEVSVDADDVTLPIGAAIPAGLIVNELISNALKHAFPLPRRGRIDVALTSQPDGLVVLSVSDDGVGFDEGADPAQMTTLGLQLVNLLTEQLGGSLSVQGADPTRFVLTFPPEKST